MQEIAATVGAHLSSAKSIYPENLSQPKSSKWGKWPSDATDSKNEFNSCRFISMSASNSLQAPLARSILADSPLNPRTTTSLNSVDSSRPVFEQNDFSFLKTNSASTSFSMS